MLPYFVEFDIRLWSSNSLEGLFSVFSSETIHFLESLILKLALLIEVIVIIKGLCPYLGKLKVGPLYQLCYFFLFVSKFLFFLNFIGF